MAGISTKEVESCTVSTKPDKLQTKADRVFVKIDRQNFGEKFLAST